MFRWIYPALAVFMIWLIGFVVGASIMYNADHSTNTDNNTPHCDCTIDWNGSQVPIEDAIQLAIEGLSINQANEVQGMINRSLESR